VTDMGSMFSHCTRLRELDLSSFDTSKVVYMTRMFSGCESLTHLDLSGFNTSMIGTGWFGYEVSMKEMFDGCESLEEWTTPETWPMEKPGAIPEPTSARNEWWSQRDAKWMNVDEIRSRGRVVDTFTRSSSAE